MKKIVLLTFVTFLIITLTACSTNKITELEPAEETNEEILGFKIEKILLSKGYQTLEPKVETITKDNKTKLSISFGLIECSGVTIDKITKKNNEINIYTNRLLEDDKTQLAIPQATVLLDKILDGKTDNYKFNIINKNYSPIELKFGKTEILNNIYAQFKIAPNSIPDVSLIRQKDSFVWNIVFNGIFDRGNLQAPLINLNVKADALTGEIIDSDKDIVSDYIDDGMILDYIPKKYLLYKQENLNNNETIDVLWLYDLEKKEKHQIYETNHSIYLSKFSPDHKNISLIENDNGVTNIYLINIGKKVIHKITPVGHSHTWNMEWKNANNLYFIDNSSKGSSIVFLYSIKDNNVDEIYKIPKNISSFDIEDDLLVLTEYDDKKINKAIFITEDGVSFDKIDIGHNISFLDKNTIVYLKNISDKNEDKLFLYNVKDKKMKTQTDINVINYLQIKPEVLLLIEKNSCENDYKLLYYNTAKDKVREIARINNEKIYYDEELNKGYISLSPPLENSKRHIIYSIDLNKMKIKDK
ncbi:hypothetical protein [Anaerosalibacter sp. Marseille-P3206]|uniref:hypothetical protein n=1 Tax=Anaerosalibacter sp. Marseille-P3206 TaxID=1871005 RepID=UPI000985BC34|nr:hypothetical protein [Anaerosalibacter sp. Marseille-P3206]